MQLSELVTALREDTGDASLGWYTCVRAFEYAAAQVNHDLGTEFAITNNGEDDGTILPDPTAAQKEGLILLARYLIATRQQQTASRTALKWKTGDVEVDRSRSSLSAENLAESLRQQYVDLFDLDVEACVLPAVYEPTGSDDA